LLFSSGVFDFVCENIKFSVGLLAHEWEKWRIYSCFFIRVYKAVNVYIEMGVCCGFLLLLNFIWILFISDIDCALRNRCFSHLVLLLLLLKILILTFFRIILCSWFRIEKALRIIFHELILFLFFNSLLNFFFLLFFQHFSF
jgi:hypothetical protein